MSITVTFNSYEEMVAFAKQIAGVPEQGEVKQKVKKAKEPIPSENNAPADIEEEEKSSEDNKHTSLTLEDVRKMFVEKNSIRGNTTKLKAILKEFKVAKVTDLEVKDFEAVMQKLEEV